MASRLAAARNQLGRDCRERCRSYPFDGEVAGHTTPLRRKVSIVCEIRLVVYERPAAVVVITRRLQNPSW